MIQIFFEDIKLPTMIRGAFFVSYSSQEKIDFIVNKYNLWILNEYNFHFSQFRLEILKRKRYSRKSIKEKVYFQSMSPN